MQSAVGGEATQPVSKKPPIKCSTHGKSPVMIKMTISETVDVGSFGPYLRFTSTRKELEVRKTLIDGERSNPVKWNRWMAKILTRKD